MKRVRKPNFSKSCSIEGCKNAYYGRGFCHTHHQWHWNHGLIKPLVKQPIREKLLANIMPVTESGCWIWMAELNSQGYGRVSIGHQNMRFAHRVSYTEFKGEIPKGMSVCHKCDVPPCINPDHLFLGTHEENMRDSFKKGRLKVPQNEIGVNHPRCILTADQIRAIRKDKRSCVKIAQDFRIDQMTIRRVKKYETYKDVL